MNRTKRFSKYFLLISLSLLFFSFTYQSAPEEFTNLDLGSIILLIFIVCVIQSLICDVLINKIVLQNLLLSLFSLSNIITLNFVLNDDFIQLPYYLVFIYGSVAIFIFYTCLEIISEYPSIAVALPVVIVSVSLCFLGNSILSVRGFSISTNESGMTTAKNIKLVDFKKKPNVYLISFDSLIPKPIFKSLFQTKDVAAYHKVLDAHFSHFANLFTDDVPTKASLSSLMALDMDHYESMEYNSRYSVFTGITPSPLYEIFKHNGYETNTVFHTGYFGKKGPYVDYYHITDEIIGVCEFFPEELKPYIFYGYCTPPFSRFLQNIYGSSKTTKKITIIDHLLRSMRQNLNNLSPQIYIGYLYRPGHAPVLNFTTYDKADFEKYKQEYIKQSSRVAEFLEKLVHFVKNEDPEAILYVFGDHGPYLTRTIKFEEAKKFVIHDRFAVYGGIFPPTKCADSFSRPYQKDYVTVMQTVHMIIRCLTGGEEAFIAQKHFSIRKYNTTEEARSYETYLYE